MRRIRARDLRAIAFCVVTAPLAAYVAFSLISDRLIAGAVTVAYAAFIGTRPRMIRVYRRLRGENHWDWSGYYRD